MVQRLGLADSVGTESNTSRKSTIADQQALKFLGDNMRHAGERYEVGLTRKENVQLRNNYPVAKTQLESLQSKDETLRFKYQETWQTDLEKGYVKPVVFTEPQPETVCYLPHPPVCNPKKPGKVRRVASAASSF